MTLSTYSEYQRQAASEKIGLVIVEAAKRLMGWTLHSGSVYKLSGFEHSVITSIEDLGTSYVDAGALADVSTGKYFNDRSTKTLYLQSLDSSNPNSRFLAMTFRMFFSNVPVIAPCDLAAGKDVEWLPLLQSTSGFGVELDNHYQLGQAIEGSGSVAFVNDREFWSPLFDSVYLENQLVLIYSWTRELPIAEAKLIYRGRIESKSYDDSKIAFNLKDYLNELRAPVPLADIETFPGARIPASLKRAKQRTVYGYVFGHRPANIDQVVETYPITGTVTIDTGSNTLTGAGTAFLKELTPDDQIFFGDDLTQYTIADVTSDTTATLTENYGGPLKAGVSGNLNPSRPKRWINRKFLVAGHPLCEPTTEVIAALGPKILKVASVRDFRAGDEIVVGTALSAIRGVSGNYLMLSLSLSETPAPGTIVKRPPISNVYLNDRKLILGRDYTYDADEATITLNDLAEFNVAPVRVMQGILAFSTGSRSVSLGTAATKQVAPGDWIRVAGFAEFFEVLKVTDDATIVLRSPATYTHTGPVQAKSPEVYEEGDVVLSCDVIGRTDDGTTGGALLCTGPAIVQDILLRLGLGDAIDASSFVESAGLAGQRIGLAVPAGVSETKAPSVKDVINGVNQSVFGSLIQSADFKLQYTIFSPRRPASVLVLKEFDIIKFSIESRSDNMVRTARVEYQPHEYDPISKSKTTKIQSKESRNARFLAKTQNEKTFPTVLVDDVDAQILANRWAFILEVASSVIKIQTKLQAARSQANDPVLVQHEKLYERIGSTSKRKVASIQVSKKSISGVELEIEDLANAFSRCACIAAEGSLDWIHAGESERVINGYITDQYGMMDNDPKTFGINLIW